MCRYFLTFSIIELQLYYLWYLYVCKNLKTRKWLIYGGIHMTCLVGSLCISPSFVQHLLLQVSTEHKPRGQSMFVVHSCWMHLWLNHHLMCLSHHVWWGHCPWQNPFCQEAPKAAQWSRSMVEVVSTIRQDWKRKTLEDRETMEDTVRHWERERHWEKIRNNWKI